MSNHARISKTLNISGITLGIMCYFKNKKKPFQGAIKPQNFVERYVLNGISGFFFCNSAVYLWHNTKLSKHERKSYHKL